MSASDTCDELTTRTSAREGGERTTAAFEDWLDVFEGAYRALPAEPELACPNCTRRTLRIVFTGPRGSDVGYASLWCDTCLEGALICRALIPPGVTARSIETPDEERVPRIPNYRLAI